MLRRALLLAAVVGLAAAYSAGSYDNDRYNYNNENQQTYSRSQSPTKDIFCFLNATNIVRQPYHDIHSETRGPFGINNVRADLCTHIVYNAVELDLNRHDIRPIDVELERSSAGRITFADLTTLKERNPHLKLMLSLSGRASDFSILAHNIGQHAAFANNVNHYLRKIRFDGISIDWQYPTRDDRGSFTIFMTTLKKTLRSEGYLLATVLPEYLSVIEEAYDQPQDLFDAIDYWFIMTIDISKQWYETKAPAPMDSRDGNGIMKIVSQLKRIFHQNSYKLILAIPFRGKQRSLLNTFESQHPESAYNGRDGPEEPLAYNKICRMLMQDHWEQSWEDLEMVPYAQQRSQKRLLIYDDAQSVKIKTQFAMKSRLGGVMAYTIDMDDYEGMCTRYGSSMNNRRYNDQTMRAQDVSSTAYPLLQSIYETIQRDPNSAGVHTSSLALILAITVAMILNNNG